MTDPQHERRSWCVACTKRSRRADFETVLVVVDPDVEITQTSELPWGGEYPRPRTASPSSPAS